MLEDNPGQGHIPCQSACPLRVDGRRIMLAAGRGDLLDLLRLISRDNPLPSVCACICPAWCQSRCVRSNLDDGLQIQAAVRFTLSQIVAGDPAWPLWALHYSSSSVQAPEKTKAAVIGAGPSGLAAAWRLASFGAEVTVFEAASGAGGRLCSLPETSLPASLLQRDINAVMACGAAFVFGHRVEELQSLSTGYSIIICAAGSPEKFNIDQDYADKLHSSGCSVVTAGQYRLGDCHPVHSVADGIQAAEEALSCLFPGSGWAEHRFKTDIFRQETPAASFRKPSGILSHQPSGRLPVLEEIQSEGKRCLDCSILPRLNSSGCGDCIGCISVCPMKALELIQYEAGTFLAIQPDICIRCGLCAEACQNHSIVLSASEHRREFRIVKGV